MKVRLTDSYVQKLKIKDTSYSIGDTLVVGLRIRINKTGSKRFYYCYRPSKDVDYTWAAIPNGDFISMNIPQARKAALDLRTQIINGQSPRDIKLAKAKQLTLEELISIYEIKKLPDLKKSTCTVFRSLVGCWILQDCKKEENYKIVKQLPDISKKVLDEISLDDVEKIKRKIEETSKFSADKLMKIMRAVFNFAIKRKLITNNPFAEVELNKKLADKQDNRILSESDRERVIVNAIAYSGPKLDLHYYNKLGLNPVACTLIGYACLTARRYYSEGSILKWSNIDWDNKTLNLEDSKVGQMSYALSDATIKLLRAIQREQKDPASPFYNPDNYIFPAVQYYEDKGWTYLKTHIGHPKKVWKSLCEKLGIPLIPMKQLRHTTATYLLKKTKNLALVQRALGHTKISTTGRYAKILGEDYRDGINALDQVTITITAEVIKLKK